tara:strand:+ start:650 stop:850 length:201 start_codon:yes stop_codon:yes gene_type:complete
MLTRNAAKNWGRDTIAYQRGLLESLLNILGNLDSKYGRNVLPKERSQLENSISMLDKLDEEQGNIR